METNQEQKNNEDTFNVEVSGPIERKDIRLLLEWRSSIINFGTVKIGDDGSFYFSSAILNSSKEYPVIKIGDFEGKSFSSKKEFKNTGDLHFSLHPNSETPNFHIRKNNSKEDLIVGTINWFPVEKDVLLLRVIAPPLEDCLVSKKESHVIMSVPDEYTSSVNLYFTIFPKDRSLPVIKETEPVILCKNQNYCVSVCISFPEEDLPPALLVNKELL